MSKIVVAVLVIGVIVGVIFYGLKGQKQIKNEDTSVVSISTFKECAQSKQGKIGTTFPRQCESPDGKTYIEKVDEPVDTNSWTVFSGVQGFSFKCPPSWKCQKLDESAATIYQNHYLNISSFQFNRITPQNFQDSFLRNPNYKTPMSWFKDLEAKKELAIKVLPETIKQGKWGTDERIPPRYYYFKFDKMSELETKKGKALIFPGEGGYPDTSVIIPLNTTDVILVTLSPEYLYQDPIVKSIISTVSQ